MTSSSDTPRINPKGLEFESLKGKLARRTAPAEPATEAAGAGTATAPAARRPRPEARNSPARSSGARPAAGRRGQGSGRSSTGQVVGERGRQSDLANRPDRRRVAFTLPVDLRDALAEAARASSQAEVIFDAIEANLEDIPQLLAEAGATEGGGLFERSRRGPAQHRVPTTVWMSVPNVARIDELVEEHQAATRTQLLEVVLRRYLQPAA